MRNKREILALAASIIIAAVVLCRFTVLVTPKQHDYGATWGHYLAEETDSVDVLFIGSSMTYCDIVPAVFWEQSGLTSYVVAGPELTIPLERYYFQEALKTQSPQVAFFELSSVFFGRYMNYTKTDIGQMPWGMNRLKATFLEAEPEHITGLLFPMLFYHDRWDRLTADDWNIAENGYEPDMLAGYTFLNQYVECGDIFTRNMEIDQENIQRNKEILKEIHAICQENDITPVFYLAPAIGRMPQEEVDSLKAYLSELDGAVILDCNEPEQFDAIGADRGYDYYDNLHFNGAGAEKYSRYLADWVAENLAVRPEQEQDTQLWQQRVQYFEEKAAAGMTQKKKQKS